MQIAAVSRRVWLCGALLMVLVAFPLQVRAAESEFVMSVADANAASLLGAALNALDELEVESLESIDRRSLADTALSSFIALYQLHGCAWVLEPLQHVYTLPDCPPLLIGFSTDGRVEVRAEPLKLQNETFDEYTIMFITLQSNTSHFLNGVESSEVTLITTNGERYAAELLSPQHELWPALQRMENTFLAPAQLVPGDGQGYKAIFALNEYKFNSIAGLELEWGGYTIVIPNYRTEVASD